MKTIQIELPNTFGKFTVLEDATFYKQEDGGVLFFKILEGKVMVQNFGNDIQAWSPTVIEQQEILGSDEYKSLGPIMHQAKKALEQDRTELDANSWEEHPVHKEDQTKIPVQYCPPVAVEGIGQTLHNSTAIKGREPWNWREGEIDLMGYLGKTIRHIHKTIDRVDKDDLDPEIGTHHLDCAMADLAIIRDAMRQGTLVDNRPPANITFLTTKKAT